MAQRALINDAMQARNRQEIRRATAEELSSARRKAFSHDLRHNIYLIAAEREVSPTEISQDFNVSLDVARYHFDYLSGKKPERNPFEFIELVNTDTKRGGTQHFYKAVEQPLADMETSAQLSRLDREHVNGTIANRFTRDYEKARLAGTNGRHPQETFLRVHKMLDDQAVNEIAELEEEVLRRRQEIAIDSELRQAAGETTGRPFAMHQAVFEVPELYG